MLPQRILVVLLGWQTHARNFVSTLGSRRAGFLLGILFSVSAAHPTFAATPKPVEQDTLATIGFFFAGLIGYIAATIAQGVVTLIEVVVVPLMQYNNFSSSPVVSAGWAIVRDSMNLFFVIVLIVIAVGTIFGAHMFHWQQQVPKLLFMAVLINFSKTLCGIMIDASQVVMLTFVNAIKDIAGGNFLTLLGMNNMFSLDKNHPGLSPVAIGQAQEDVAGAFEFFANSVMVLLMIIFVFATMVALTAILAFRIVMLWVLVTISPLAFFLRSVDFVHTSAYADWWKNFKCFLVIGPVITFFVWLALAVAGAGSIAATESFVQPGANTGGGSAGGFVGAIFEMGHLTSFIIGMAMIFAGFKAAAEFCAGATGGSFMTGALGKATAWGLKAPAGLMARTAARGARGTLRGTASLAGGAAGRIPVVRSVATRQGQAGLLRGMQRGLGAAGLTGLGAVAGRAAGKREKVTAGAIQASGKEFEDKKQAEAYAANMATQEGKSFSTNDQNKDKALLLGAMKDKDLQKAMGPGFEKMMKAYWEDLKAADHGATDEFAKKRIDALPEEDQAKALEKINTAKDAEGLDKESYKVQAVRDKMKTIPG
ncbi:MAG: hypothetical protein UY77_C0036G0001, partial [Candidatus Uhrbacteria bacterium GW2011_GWA2_53_10]